MMAMIRVLVSACLLGAKVRYHGGSAACPSDIIARWLDEGRVVPICPEVAGGLATPRAPAEIDLGADGSTVWRGRAGVRTSTGDDVTNAFVAGAAEAMRLAAEQDIRIAVLKEGSPSCGSSFTYDGSFRGVRVAGQGVAAAALVGAGIAVFSEEELDEADRLICTLDGEAENRSRSAD